MRWIQQVVEREKREKATGDLDGMGVIVGDEMNVAADAGVCCGTADFVHCAFLARHCLNYFRPADEHVRAAFDHDDEIHQRGRISRAASAGSCHNCDLRHDAGKKDVAKKYLAVSGERVEPFLDARAARIVESDHGAASLQGVIHQVADFLGVNASQRTAANGKILAEGRHDTAIHQPRARNHAVARHGFFLHAEVMAIVLGVKAGFLECAGLEKSFDAITGGHHALFAAGFQFVLAPASPCGGAPLFEFFQ